MLCLDSGAINLPNACWCRLQPVSGLHLDHSGWSTQWNGDPTISCGPRGPKLMQPQETCLCTLLPSVASAAFMRELGTGDMGQDPRTFSLESVWDSAP